MSEIQTAEDVHQFLSELDRTQPVGDPHELREREYQRRKERDQRERERQAREARKAEAKQQAPVNWDSWYAAFDARLEQHFFSGDSGVGGVFKDAIGAVLGKKAAQVRDEFKRADEEMRCAFEAKLTEQREQFLASNNQAAWVGWVDSRISATFTHGRDVLIEEVRRVIEEAQRLLEVKFVALEERVKAGLPSKLPSAKVYQSGTVHYSGDVVTHVGATYQATCDTCREPPHDDWVCIACAGRDAPVLKICGTFNAYQRYKQFDVIEFDGSSFIAVRDLDPGTIPGEGGWQLLSKNGSRGPAGEVGPRGRKGERGACGEDAPTITLWTIDRKRYRAIPTLSNGKMGAPLELRPLFEQFQLETSDAILS